MKKTISFLLALAMLFCAGCEKTPSESPSSEAPSEAVSSEVSSTQTPSFVFTKENYPRMGGSLANLPLGEAVTASVLGISREEADTMISFTGSTTDNYKALVDGQFDILLAYEPSEEAKEYIEASEVKLDLVPIGIDALVFICSLENPVDSLTVEQIKDIYRGRITNWSQVGGKDKEILPYQRNKDSGSQTLFDKFLALGNELIAPPTDALIIGTMWELLEAVADYDDSEGALGYTVYYYLTNMESEKLNRSKILKLDGVEATNESIEKGDYPLTNDFYVVIRADAPEGSPERVLRDWILSEQGQELVKRENYPVVTR